MKNNLKEVIKNLKDHIFTYSLSDGGFGIVLASDEEDAREKVRVAYQKHGGYEDKKMDGVEITITVPEEPFEDAPDVMELEIF